MVDWPRQIWQHGVVFLFLSTRTVITACNWLAGRVRASREGGAERKREGLTVTRYLPALRLILPSPGYSCWSTIASSTYNDKSQTSFRKILPSRSDPHPATHLVRLGKKWPVLEASHSFSCRSEPLLPSRLQDMGNFYEACFQYKLIKSETRKHSIRWFYHAIRHICTRDFFLSISYFLCLPRHCLLKFLEAWFIFQGEGWISSIS
jgi:hypothetical protein